MTTTIPIPIVQAPEYERCGYKIVAILWATGVALVERKEAT